MSILQQALAVTEARARQYGSPTVNFAVTARLWSVLFGMEVTPAQVCLAQLLLKVAREMADPSEEHWIDMAGYAHCGAVCQAEEP